MDLREIARPFITCKVRFGKQALFWHDEWTGLGPLLNVIGPTGPLSSGIGLDLTVHQAVVAGAWVALRGRNPSLLLLRAILPPIPEEFNSDNEDEFM